MKDGCDHSSPYIGNSLWVIGNNKKESSVCSHTVVERGGKKEREKEHVVALTQPLCSVWRGEKKVLTHSFEEILDAVGYESRFEYIWRVSTISQ